MTKQRLENDFREVLKQVNGIWWMKIQTHPLAHRASPGDFLIILPNDNFLVECKECRGPRFELDRLTQLEELKRFSSVIARNKSILLLCFWKGTKKKSSYYWITMDTYTKLLVELIDERKSLTEEILNRVYQPLSLDDVKTILCSMIF